MSLVAPIRQRVAQAVFVSLIVAGSLLGLAAAASAQSPDVLPVEPAGGIGGEVILPVEPDGGIGN